MNPEENSNIISPKVMFQYDHHTNIPWNTPQYQPVKQYLDPLMQITQRTFLTTPKGVKSQKYVTKRGFYMDYDLKIAKGIPASTKYNSIDHWDFSNQRKLSAKQKVDPKLIKYTYLQKLEIQQKNRKTPGVCTYNLNKTLAEIQTENKKLKQKKNSNGPKRFYYQQTQYLSNLVPGAGAHNPRHIQKQIHLNKTDNNFWKQKHKKQAEVLKKRNSTKPASTTYTPTPVLFSTFEKISSQSKAKKNNKNTFGTDEKFEYLRELKVKDKKKEVRPGPGSYETYIQWPDKYDKQKRGKHERNWHNRISHSPDTSIYH